MPLVCNNTQTTPPTPTTIITTPYSPPLRARKKSTSRDSFDGAAAPIGLLGAIGTDIRWPQLLFTPRA